MEHLSSIHSQGLALDEEYHQLKKVVEVHHARLFYQTNISISEIYGLKPDNIDGPCSIAYRH